MLPSSVIRYPSPDKDRRAIIIWLSFCLMLLAFMVLIGGYTRLSGSGLSITSWKPIHGIMPPLNEAQWQEEFRGYQASPQYQKVNNGMTLDEFRDIFWPEFIHRLLGRVVGAVFFLPLIIFCLRRSISKRLFWRLIGIFALGGLQGLIGWLMVKSGLVDVPHVSPIRLAAHLSTAFLVFALILWTLLDIIPATPRSSRINAQIHLWYKIWFCFLCIQIIMGAFMAGLHGGLMYNTWPTMNGQWVPDGLLADLPWYANITLIQFIHRKLAVFLVLSYIMTLFFTRKHIVDIQLKRISLFLALVLISQVMLGIITLLHYAPLALALTHQMIGLLLFATAVFLWHEICTIRKTQ